MNERSRQRPVNDSGESVGALFLMAGRVVAPARKRIHDSRKPAKWTSGFRPFTIFGFGNFLFFCKNFWQAKVDQVINSDAGGQTWSAAPWGSPDPVPTSLNLKVRTQAQACSCMHKRTTVHIMNEHRT